MAVQIARWQFTVDAYARMIATGILAKDDRVELIDGEIRAMSPRGPLHAAIVKRLTALFSPHLGTIAILGVQDPIQLNDYTEPQPDLTLLRPRDDFYARSHPQPDDVLLVIEVSDSSIEYDCYEKLPRYAAAGIPEVWLIDVGRRAIEQYLNPVQDAYTVKRLIGEDETIAPGALVPLTLPVDRILA